MTWRGVLGSLLLLAAVGGTAAFLYVKKQAADRTAVEAIKARPEPMEFVTVAAAKEREHQRVTTVDRHDRGAALDRAQERGRRHGARRNARPRQDRRGRAPCS